MERLVDHGIKGFMMVLLRPLIYMGRSPIWVPSRQFILALSGAEGWAVSMEQAAYNSVFGPRACRCRRYISPPLRFEPPHIRVAFEAGQTHLGDPAFPLALPLASGPRLVFLVSGPVPLGARRLLTRHAVPSCSPSSLSHRLLSDLCAPMAQPGRGLPLPTTRFFHATRWGMAPR